MYMQTMKWPVNSMPKNPTGVHLVLYKLKQRQDKTATLQGWTQDSSRATRESFTDASPRTAKPWLFCKQVWSPGTQVVCQLPWGLGLEVICYLDLPKMLLIALLKPLVFKGSRQQSHQFVISNTMPLCW